MPCAIALTDFARDDSTDSEVRVHVLAALQRARIRLAVAEYNIHTVIQIEKHLQDIRARDIARRLDALKQVDLFSELDAEELRTVRERLEFTPFARGDVMTRQGAVAHWLSILISGEADVVVERPNGGHVPVAVLDPGTCFGEMGLLTGDPRHATVIAKSNAECYRLDKASLEDALHSRPALAEHFSRLLTVRQADLDQHLARADAAARQPQRNHSEMLAAIRRFFGLDHA